MSTVATRSGVFTYDQFSAIVADGKKGDLIDGAIYMASPDNIDANDVSGWLYMILRHYARKRKLGRVFISRVACRLDDKNAPEPDVLFVAEKNHGRLKRGGLEGPPDLAIEVVSPDSVERDCQTKRRQYQLFRVPEYWIIDPDEQRITLLRLDSRGRYREAAPRNGIYYSHTLDGFWLDPNWLWQDPLPDELEILQRLLAS